MLTGLEVKRNAGLLSEDFECVATKYVVKLLAIRSSMKASRESSGVALIASDLAPDRINKGADLRDLGAENIAVLQETLLAKRHIMRCSSGDNIAGFQR